MAEPAFRSPVTSGARRAGRIALTDETATAKVLVRADPAGNLARWLAVEPGRATRDADGTLRARFGPDEWLLVAGPGAAPALVARLEAVADDDLVTVIDMTSGRALLRLSGPVAPDVLAKVCAVDAGAATDGTAFRSYLAGVVAEVIRDDAGGAGERSYLIACDWSYGQYLFDVLADAGAEFEDPPRT